MKSNVYVMLIGLLCLVSCQSKTSDSKVSDNSTSGVTTEVPKGKYAIKSGIVVYNTTMMRMEVKQTLTFDDYGNKEITDIMMEMMGTKIHTVSLTKDGFIYSIDMVNKTGTKTSLTLNNNANIDFQNLSEEMSKDMNLKKEGQEDFLNKTCEKISIDYTKMNMKGNYLVYKGVALKVDTNIGAMKMKLVAEKFEENPQIPADKFEIPTDITISGN